MPAKRKVVIQASEPSKSVESRKDEREILEARRKRFKLPDEEDEVVDYSEEQSEVPSQSTNLPEKKTVAEEQTPLSPEEEERARITKALESWCNNNIAKQEDPDVGERVSALAEVGLLLVFDLEKYHNAESMRAELEDIGSIIGGEQVVTRYINFILSLQNQLKKTRAIAERQLRQQHMMHHQQQMPFQRFPMPMMAHPGGPQWAPQPMYPPAPRGNLTLNTTGEMTAVEKQREKERKRKEILAECTQHLKALLERVTKATDPEQKAKIYELIDKVKKRIDSLKDATPPATPAPAQAPKGPVRGFFGNQYINPKLLEQQQPQ